MVYIVIPNDNFSISTCIDLTDSADGMFPVLLGLFHISICDRVYKKGLEKGEVHSKQKSNNWNVIERSPSFTFDVPIRALHRQLRSCEQREACYWCRGVTVVVPHCPLASSDVPQGLAKLMPKSLCNRDKPSVQFFLLWIKQCAVASCFVSAKTSPLSRHSLKGCWSLVLQFSVNSEKLQIGAFHDGSVKSLAASCLIFNYWRMI